MKYVGEVPEKGCGTYVGIQLDEPLGDCSGMGKFECLPKFGVFVNILEVEVGDFPELEMSSSEL